jgi:crotonobetainyl-CoA:carnitine CoA-transferase CaiB-like acyl-CoA transferase
MAMTTREILDMTSGSVRAEPGKTPSALGHIRVVEMGQMPAAYCAGYLAGLGADVIKVEPPGGDTNRWLPPFAGDIEDPERSIPFLNANLNRRSIVLDVAKVDGREALEHLLERADIFVEATPVGYLAMLGLDTERLKSINPGLVTVSLTPFGQWGPYSHFAANDAVVSAMSGVMMTQGDRSRAPVVVPCQIGSQLAGVHGAYTALAGVRHSRRTGLGQRIDLSLQEAISYAAFSSTVRYSHAGDIVTRPAISGADDIFRTKNGGYVQIAIFMAGHWRALARDWMQDPVLSRPEWDTIEYRKENQDRSQALIQQFVEGFGRDEFVAQAQKRGIACSPLNTLEEFVTNDHMRQRGWFCSVEHPAVGVYEVPGAPFIMSRTPWTISRPAPLLDQHREEILAELARVPPRRETAAVSAAGPDPRAPPLNAIRVADITRAFAGPIGTMFLGFYGAEVIKVESEGLDANRDPVRPLFPDMNRNKLSCTIDLRSAGGKTLFMRLVERSDLVVENFSATVMKRLGLGYDELVKVKPDIIQIGMPGMGTTGPLKEWVSYGQNLQAFTGLSLLWGHPDSPMQSHAKGVLPDYVGSALLALAATAALEYRDRSGFGQAVEVCQIDGQGSMMGPAILDYTINHRLWGSIGYREPLAAKLSPFGCYPCRYDDTWIVIAGETDDHWRNLVAAMGATSWADAPRLIDRAGRCANRDEIDRGISAWTRAFTPHQLLYKLQRAGVPAGIAMNGEQIYHDPHLRARGHLVAVEHSPWGKLTHLGLPAIPSLSKVCADQRAPWLGDDNDYVFKRVLGLSQEEISAGVAAGSIR